ncbi:hypothetical protein [Streptomyces fructofermentans]|uniref:hypothetical protein n=1 Tax=Streptomyces fructofermentans TaxID=152141 RepID=UPI003F4D5858
MSEPEEPEQPEGRNGPREPGGPWPSGPRGRDGGLRHGLPDGRGRDGVPDGRMREGAPDGRMREGAPDGRMREGVPDGRNPEGRGERDLYGDGRATAAGLSAELRALGRSLDRPGAVDGGTMAERVLERILAEGVPAPVAVPPRPDRLRTLRRWARLRRRALTAGLCGLLTVLVLTPPVRAAVVEWFDFGGVEVRYDPSATPSPGAGVPGCGGPSLTLAEAGHRAGFAPRVPPALGAPDAVTVTPEPKGRFLISLCWRERGHTVRLDEYAAALNPGFTKLVREQPQFVPLDGEPAPQGSVGLWFAEPHVLRLWLVDSAGDFTASERTAGPTLLWTHGGDMTLRLEGVASRDRAVEIAKSLE